MSYLQSCASAGDALSAALDHRHHLLFRSIGWRDLGKAGQSAARHGDYSPFWVWSPTLKHFYKLLFESYYPHWLWNTMYVAVCATILSIIASVLAAIAIVRLRYKGAHLVGGLISSPIWCAVDPVHSACDRRVPVRPVRLAPGADPDRSDILKSRSRLGC